MNSSLGRHLALTLCGAAALHATPGLAQTPAPAYPKEAVKWVVPYPAGGGTDVVARMLGAAMGQSMAQTIIIENKPGAGTMIGGEQIAHAEPDSYTVGTVDTSTVALAPHLYAKVPYRAD